MFHLYDLTNVDITPILISHNYLRLSSQLIEISSIDKHENDNDEVESESPPKTAGSETDEQLSSRSHKPKQAPLTLMTPPTMDHDEQSSLYKLSEFSPRSQW